jgi:hypothetical protein
MFGDQASPSVKMFVNLAQSQLQVSIDITMSAAAALSLLF